MNITKSLASALDCDCCVRGFIEVETGLAVAVQHGVGYANASRPSAELEGIEGITAEDYGKFFQVQIWSATFRVLSYEDSEYRGQWKFQGSLIHSGAYVVATPAEINFVATNENDDDPDYPYYVDRSTILSGTVELSVEVTRKAIIAFASSEAQAAPLVPASNGAVELFGSHSGVYYNDGYAVAQYGRYTPSWSFRETEDGPDRVSIPPGAGIPKLPVVVELVKETEDGPQISQSKSVCPWQPERLYFSELPLDDPTDWIRIPFDLSGDTLYEVRVVFSVADIWPAAY